jgi:hypothetical protein
MSNKVIKELTTKEHWEKVYQIKECLLKKTSDKRVYDKEAPDNGQFHVCNISLLGYNAPTTNVQPTCQTRESRFADKVAARRKSG